MAARDYDHERADHTARQTRAADKIRVKSDLAKRGGPQQQAEDQQLMNEMRGNKAAVDFNRALFDYEVEMTVPVAHNGCFT